MKVKLDVKINPYHFAIPDISMPILSQVQ